MRRDGNENMKRLSISVRISIGHVCVKSSLVN